MRRRISAGLLLYRVRQGRLEVFLAHPGGPYSEHKDDGHWTIPKGEVEPGEDLLTTAVREFQEETGMSIDPRSQFLELGSIRQKSGKTVYGWAVAGDRDETVAIQSNTFELEWPPHSGRRQTFPEVDRAQFFPIPDAKRKLKEAQTPLLVRLERILGMIP